MIEKDYTTEAQVLFEHSLAIGGLSYLVIYGMHINGGFICIPNWNIGCEAANNEYSIDFNTDKLINAGMKEEDAREIAAYIDNWLLDNKELMQELREEANNRLLENLKKM